MTEANDSATFHYPPGFRARRGLNWGFLGLLYTSFYMCRYNLSIANGAISKEFGFTREDMGMIITTMFLAYGFGQIVNGMICDKIGGKRSMLIGAAGTVVMNILFGAASFCGVLHPELADAAHPHGHWLTHLTLFHSEIFFRLLVLFVAIRGVDGYMQAYGSPGMIKINTAWFAQRERGRFAGVYGFMINLGRFGIFNLGPALLAGFVFLGMWRVPPLHWRWLFWVPSAICAVGATGMALTVKETPEAAGFHDTHASESVPVGEEAGESLGALLLKIVTHPTIWFVASAYACTGAVRQAIDQWFPRYMQDRFHMDLASAQFQWLGFLIPFVASVGSLTSGYISDTLFKGHRAPVAAGIYFLETAVILLAAQFHSANAAIFFLVAISLTANSTHSLLGTAAAMDIGGRRNSGFVSGVIDSFQYFGGALAGIVLGKLLDRSLGNYFYFMVPFGVIGGILMLVIRGTVKPEMHRAAQPMAAVIGTELTVAARVTPANELSPFQSGIKRACIWAEAHQGILFFSLWILLAVLGTVTVISSDMKARTEVIIFTYLAFVPIVGAVAAAKRRHIWAWGLIGSVFTFLPLLALAYLPKNEPADADKSPAEN